jgi:hypothetical protein
MEIDTEREWIFELNDFSNMKVLDFENNTKLYYMDNFYKYPDLVLDYLNSKEPPLWKYGPDWDPYKKSKNTKDFEDRRHQLDHIGMENVYKKLSKLCGQHPSSYTEIVTNYTRFSRCKNNNYVDNYWWPHHDTGYNGICYFNDYNGEEYDGTYIYKPKDENIAKMHQKGEHEDPWTPKSEWDVLLKIKAKYNRFVMFDGFEFWHGMYLDGTRWFADNYKDAKYRVNQVFFFTDKRSEFYTEY